MRGDAIGYSAMLLIVQSSSPTKGVTVDKLGFQPTAFCFSRRFRTPSSRR